MTCLKNFFFLLCWIGFFSSSSLLSAEGVVIFDCLFTYLFFLTDCLPWTSLDRSASLLELRMEDGGIVLGWIVDGDGGIVFGWIEVGEVVGWIGVEDFGWIGEKEGVGWIALAVLFSSS